MKKFASLCLLFICLVLVLFLICSPMINLSALNNRLFAGWNVVGSPLVQAAYTDTVDTLGGQAGDPLRVEVMNNGSLAIYTWQPVTPGSSVFGYENRYFDGFSWGSNLFLTLGADQVHLYSDYFQDLPYWREDYAFSLSADIGLGTQVVEGDSIITTWSLLDGLGQLRQTITYQPGSTNVSKMFEITNLGTQNEALVDLRFMHGGDVYFGKESACALDPMTQSITVRNLDATIGGMMAMVPGQESPLDSWFAGWIEDLFYETASGNLPGTVVANDEDIGVQLQWNRDVINAGETWTITLTERFAEETSDETGETTGSGETTTETSGTSGSGETTATSGTIGSGETTTETAESETTTTESTELETTTTEKIEPETTTTEVAATTSTTLTTESQIATSVSSDPATTTETSTDNSVPATGEGGSCQLMAGGLMLMIAALYCWFKRLHGCH